MRIRQGNDFIFLWAIERNGLPEDFSNAVNIRLHFKNFDRVSEVKSFQIVDGNIVRVEVSPEWASRLGAYRLILSYAFEDESLADNDRKCVVDVLAFNIVPKTSEADDITEMAKTTDIMIGLKGDKGDSSYQTWLDAGNTGTEADYLAWIQQPATDIEQVVSSNETVRISSEETRQLNETSRVEAEALRGSAETQRISDENTRKSNETGRINAETLRLSAEQERGTAEGLRVSSETSRNTAEGQRATAETSRATAEGLRAAAETARVNNESARQSAEELRQTNTAEAIQSANTAAQQADTATTAANSAAQNADDARDNIMPSVLNNEEVQADVYAQLNARITALEAILSNKIKDRIDVTKEFNVWGKTNLILYGNGASTKTPDFIGQKYIDTTNSNVYIAVGVSNAGNWKLV